jgi:hypothetical protein
LAAIYDSRFYAGSLSNKDSVIKGQESDCDYLRNRCFNLHGFEETEDFCSRSGKTLFDSTLTSKGDCEKGIFTLSIPPEFRYFNAPNTGGAEGNFDYCPVVVPKESESCC